MSILNLFSFSAINGSSHRTQLWPIKRSRSPLSRASRRLCFPVLERRGSRRAEPCPAFVFVFPAGNSEARREMQQSSCKHDVGKSGESRCTCSSWRSRNTESRPLMTTAMPPHIDCPPRDFLYRREKQSVPTTATKLSLTYRQIHPCHTANAL